MSNMSYCRFQNTLPDFNDCIENLENYGELSKEEQKAADEMYQYAKEYINLYNEVKIASILK
jgi:hypothetical protein